MLVLLLHGFPETWFAWRHQIKFLSGHSYHATTPDLRGYGDSNAPLTPSSYTWFHIVGDFIGLLNHFVVHQEVDTTRSRLEAGKQRKMILAAGVRFLRKRFGYFLKAKAMSSLQKEKLVRPPNLPKQTKLAKEFSRKEASRRMIPPIPEVRPKKKQYISQVASLGKSPVSQPHRKMLDGGEEFMQQSFTWLSDLSHKGRVDTRKCNLVRNTAPIIDLNKKERMHAHDTTLRYTSAAFDLNQDDSSSGKASLPSRAPIFDLNEISTGDEDFQTNAEAVKFEESKRSVMRHPKDEVQNDLMLSVCRNAGEGSARVGKRKISWQDSVALKATIEPSIRNSEYGLVKIDSRGRLILFSEKPKDADRMAMSALKMVETFFEDIFRVDVVDPDGKKFDRDL